MEEDLLRKVMGRCKRDEILTYLREWEQFEETDLDRIFAGNRSKKEITRRVVSCAKKTGTSVAQIGHLDLLYTRDNSKKKQWTVYKLEFKQGEKVADPSVTVFGSQLKKEIRVYYKTDIAVTRADGALWVRLHVHDKSEDKYLPSNTTYLILYPGQPFLMASKMKVSLAEYIIQAVIKCLGCSKGEELALTGHCYKSLAQLALNWLVPDKAKANKKGNAISAHKRKLAETKFDEKIHDEFQQIKRQREETLLDHYGLSTQPALEKVTYKMETKYKGTVFAPVTKDTDHLFQCKVTFEGSNVIEGVKNLARAGLVQLPMRAHLANLQNLGRSTLILKQKAGAQKDTPKKD